MNFVYIYIYLYIYIKFKYKHYQKYNDLMSKKHKTVSMTLNFLVHFLVFVSVVSRCVAISAFASLVGVPLVL